MANDAEAQPVQRQGGVGGSFSRLKTWAGEKPWHMWVLILIGLATLYLMYRIWKGQNSNTSGGFFAGLGGQPNNGGSSGGSNQQPPPPPATHFWDTLLHSKGNPNDTDLTDPANYNAEGYYTVGTAGGGGFTLNQLASFFNIKGGINALYGNPHNFVNGHSIFGNWTGAGDRTIPSGTEVWITRSLIQS